ncbi:hypothetical protein CHARACLAT_032930 [Characodon lateralis]|uniref:Uncharacterized protein n=1 Tax=Characodon lateralis TaxID=208331 RepID=A0ABU7FB55_9TELE|nr:hypothetical protein [Characodon lateralis]
MCVYGKWGELIQHLYNHTNHSKHFTLEPHSPKRNHILTPIQKLGALPRGTSTCGRRKLESNPQLSDCKRTTLPTEPQYVFAGSAGVDVAILDQMTLINLSDQEALDDFLNSTGEDTSSGSSLTPGPDLKFSSLESLNQVPPTNNSQSSQVAVWQEEGVASEDSEEPRVQSDEEDVQADMSLIAGLKIGTTLCSDESDSAGDNPSE